MADPNEWGPLLWTVLHTISENLGKNTHKLLQKDEIQYFQNILKQISHILPCKLCIKHYNKYYYNNKKDIQYDELKEYAKKYFYNLHEEINKDNHKESFDYDNLIRYNSSKEELQISIKKIEILFTNYTSIKLLNGSNVREFFKTLIILRKFMNYY